MGWGVKDNLLLIPGEQIFIKQNKRLAVEDAQNVNVNVIKECVINDLLPLLAMIIHVLNIRMYYVYYLLYTDH